jgi:hypothetical protein
MKLYFILFQLFTVKKQRWADSVQEDVEEKICNYGRSKSRINTEILNL